MHDTKNRLANGSTIVERVYLGMKMVAMVRRSGILVEREVQDSPVLDRPGIFVDI